MPKQSDSEFFEELKEWSERKHELLMRYLAPATKILGSAGRVYYIDGFAGRGTYGEGETTSKGSPVKAAEIAQQYEQAGKSYSFRCINVEADSDNFKNLKEATACFGDLVLNLPGTFIENLDHITHRIRNDAVICFLDPFGVKGADFEALERLVAGGRHVDFWIRFDRTIVRRLDGFSNSDDARGQGKFAALSKVYGIGDGAYIHKRLEGSTPKARLENTLSLYMERLTSLFGSARGSGYVASYPIRTNAGKHKYEMVFATGNQSGAVLASDVVYSVEENYVEQAEELAERRRLAKTPQYLLFDMKPTQDEVFTDIVDRLHTDIWQQCRGTRIKRLSLRAHKVIWGKWFGKAKASHFTAALKMLDKEGHIDRDRTEGTLGNDKTIIQFKS